MNVMDKIEVSSADRPRRRRRGALGMFIVAFCLLAAALYFGVFHKKGKTTAAAKPAAQSARAASQLVTPYVIEQRSFSRKAPVSGDVRPVNDVRVFAPANGVRIAEVLADLGDEVKAGAPLARLEKGVADSQITAARAQLEAARIDRDRAVEEYERARSIADTGALSAEAIAARKAGADAAVAKFQAQNAAASEANTRFGGGYVRAPVDGLVIEKNARVGEFADQKALFRLVGGDLLEVDAAIAEEDVLALKKGQVATFRAGDGTTVDAVLRRPPVAINTDTRTGEALFDLPVGSPIRAGMYLRGEITVEKAAQLAVPQTAISYATGEPSVFVIENGKAKRRVVKLGGRQGDFVAVVAGVVRGEVIAKSGGSFLQDGDTVRMPNKAPVAEAPVAEAKAATSRR